MSLIQKWNKWQSKIGTPSSGDLAPDESPFEINKQDEPAAELNKKNVKKEASPTAGPSSASSVVTTLVAGQCSKSLLIPPRSL